MKPPLSKDDVIPCVISVNLAFIACAGIFVIGVLEIIFRILG